MGFDYEREKKKKKKLLIPKEGNQRIYRVDRWKAENVYLVIYVCHGHVHGSGSEGCCATNGKLYKKAKAKDTLGHPWSVLAMVSNGDGKWGASLDSIHGSNDICLKVASV
jgi:hypothetical protein